MTKQYKAYKYAEDAQDPIIPTLRRLIGNHKYSYVSEQTGVTVQTLYNWFDHKTVRRPQFTTVAAIVYGMGFSMKIVKGRVR